MRLAPLFLLFALGAPCFTGCSTKRQWLQEGFVRPPDPPLGQRCDDAGGGPLKEWMKEYLQPAVARSDTQLKGAMDALAEIAPEGYRDWAYWAGKAGKSAGRPDPKPLQAACQGCHDMYSLRYCADDRARRLQDE